MKRAKGEVKRLLRVISRLQDEIGRAKGWQENDRSPMAFSNAQDALIRAFNLCVETTGDYDPSSYDESYDNS